MSTRLWGPPSLLSNGYRGSFSRGIKRGQGVTLTTHLHLVPRSCMSRSYTSSPHHMLPQRVVGLLHCFLLSLNALICRKAFRYHKLIIIRLCSVCMCIILLTKIFHAMKIIRYNIKQLHTVCMYTMAFINCVSFILYIHTSPKSF
jgi:hypothetical protein